eukprot:m.153509 g.153509  ORF g.153509 m.153509 type:complete len:125 (+) comp17918_c0_seq1:543-917(+)
MEVRNRSAEVVLADEVAQNGELFKNKFVRVLGKVSSLDPRVNTATITIGNHKLAVDLTLVGPCVKVGSLFQFVGEVECTKEGDSLNQIVRAQFGRCVDGLDITLFKQALMARRSFLQEVDASNG